MAIKSNNIKLKRATRLAREGAFLSGAGRDERLPIGILNSDSRRHRAYLRLADSRFPASFWEGAYRGERMELWAYKLTYYRVADGGGSGRVRIRRTTAGETEGTSNTLSSSNGGGSIWPGPAQHGASEVRGPTLAGGTGKWVKVADITQMSKVWWPTSIGGTGAAAGDTMFGLLIAQDADDWTSNPGYTGAVDNVEFASDNYGDGSKAPELRFFFDDNAPPAAPSVLSPEPSSSGGAAVLFATTSGTELTVEFDFSDPDDNVCAKVELEVYPNAIVDATPPTTANRTKTTGPITPTGTGTARRYKVKLTGLPARTDQRHRLRVQDPKGAWGPWTSLDLGRIKTAYLPGLPLQPLMQTNPERPHIFGTINSPDTGDYVTGWEGESYRDNPDGSTTTLWAPGVIAIGGTSTRSDVEYAGTQLNDGDKVRWRHRHTNRDGIVGAWSTFYTTTMKTQLGPTITPADTSTKLTSRTGPVTIASASFDGYQYRLFRGETQIYDSGVVTVPADTSEAVTLPSGYINWGDVIGIEPATRPAGTGVLGPFAPRSLLYFNTLPTTTLAASDGLGSTGTVVPTTDILWESPYLDRDRAQYGEQPVSKALEVRTAATPAGSGAVLFRRENVKALGWLPESERTGRLLDLLTDATNTSVDADVTADTFASAPTGYAGSSLRIRFTGASAIDRGARKTVSTGATSLAVFGPQALHRIQRFVTSATNLVRIVIRYEFATTADYAEYSIFEAADALSTWAVRAPAMGAPLATAGTVDWSLWSGVVRLFADVSGAYTGDLYVRDLRIGVTQTAKTVPDGSIAPEASVDARVRYQDDAAALVATTLAADAAAGATNIKVASVAGMAVGQDVTIRNDGAGHQAFSVTRTITVVGTAGSGGSGVTVGDAFEFGGTTGWKVWVYPWGPWTPWLTRKASIPPTAAAGTPTDRALILDPTADLVHTYVSIGGKAQASRVYRLYRRLGYFNRVLAGGPASLWRLSEPSGAFGDSAGAVSGTANGTMTRGVTGALSPADTDGAVDLDGSTGYITFGDVYDFVGVLPFTVAAWIRPDAWAGAGTSAYIFGKLSVTGTTNGWDLVLSDAGMVRLYRTVAGVTASATALTAAALGTLTHVVATFDGTSQRLYVNGVLEATTADVGSMPGNASLLTIGRSAHTAGSYFNGLIDEPAIWSRALSAAEVLADFASRLEVPGDQQAYEKTVTGTGLTDTLPTLLLADATAYAWEKTGYDSDGLSGTTTRRSFSTQFAQPAAVAGLVAVADPATGAITLTWTASADPYLDHYRVYWRDQAGQDTRVDLGPIAVDDARTKLTDAAFTFYGGRLGSNEFAVTVHNGSLESEIASVETTLAAPRGGSWAIRGDGEERYTFPFDPDDMPRTSNGTVETFRPPGARYPTHLHWGQSGRSVSVRSTYIPDADGDLATVVRELFGTGRAFWVAAPSGYQWDVMRVRVVGPPADVVRPGGMVQVSLELDEVDPEDT